MFFLFENESRQSKESLLPVAVLLKDTAQGILVLGRKLHVSKPDRHSEIVGCLREHARSHGQDVAPRVRGTSGPGIPAVEKSQRIGDNQKAPGRPRQYAPADRSAPESAGPA